MLNKEYQEYVYACVDVIIKNEEGKILLTKRNVEPFKNTWILPGGRMKLGELPLITAQREIFEETGLQIEPKKLYGVYADPNRDPRCYTVSIIYVAEISGGEMIKTLEVSAYKWIDKNEIPQEIGFDHRDIIEDFFKFPEEQQIDNNFKNKDFNLFKK
ncbi:MAG: NUDIX hydrolase [Patescibacteria group bacterium]